MKVFIVSDTHFPFHSKKAYKKMLHLIKSERPDVVIQIGDLLDQYVFSKYSRSLGIKTEDDIWKGVKCAKQMWADIHRIVPKAKLYQLLGNHDLRMAKRISEKLPELETVVKTLSLYQFDHVKTLNSDRDFLILDNVVYVHGWLGRSVDHIRYFGKSVVHGHTHRPEIVTEGRLWVLNVGYLADSKSLPLSYAPSKHSKWRTACGMVEDGQPKLFLL